MDRRTFFGTVAAVTAGCLTRGSSAPVPPPLVSHYLTEPTEWYVQKYALGFEVSQEVVEDDLYGVLNG